MKTLNWTAACAALLMACSSEDRGDTGGGDGGGAGDGGATGDGGSSGDPDAATAENSCTGFSLPETSDYGGMGPFATIRVDNTGPDGMYTMFRPETLGEDGFKHPPATWGNGIFTDPGAYAPLLSTYASHGFVVIASNSTMVSPQLMTAGLDWLIAQNDAAGDFQGKLATTCAASIGYSLGGRGSVETGAHANVVTTISFHGLQGASESLHGPLLLVTSRTDGFVTTAGNAQPCYDRSTVVPTVLADLDVPGAPVDNQGHLIPLSDAGQERAPSVAWLRYWVYGDEGARHYFFGSDCVVCTSPWINIQRKNLDWE